jgi:hypothetical protein
LLAQILLNYCPLATELAAFVANLNGVPDINFQEYLSNGIQDIAEIRSLSAMCQFNLGELPNI